jgi:flagellar FliL protein
MSAKAEKEEGKKKGGKLPIIIVAVLVLAGGGFFMMKPKGDGKKPAVQLGHDTVDMGEILVNLKGGGSYARLNVGLQFDSTFDTHAVDSSKAMIRDSIIMVLSGKTMAEVATPEGKEALKVEIAAAINHKFHALHAKDDKKDKDKDGKEAKEDHGSDEGHGSGEKKEREHPDWHSDEGPVLIVYFSDFVTQ